MKFTCHQATLRAALVSLSRVLPAKTTLQVLRNICMVAVGESVVLTATDLNTAITITVPAKVKASGAVTVSGKFFTSLVNTLASELVHITLDDNNQLHIDCENNKSQLMTIAASEYPAIPDVQSDKSVVFNREPFFSAIKMVARCAADDDSRPVLNAVRFVITGNECELVAADGFRLAKTTIPVDNRTESDFTLLIPVAVITELIRAIAAQKDESTIQMNHLNAQVGFSVGDTKLVSRTIAGTYPDVGRVIPKEFTTTTVVAIPDLVQAVNVIAAMSEVGLECVFAENSMVVKSTGGKSGNNGGVIPAEFHGTSHRMGLNISFLKDALSVFGGAASKISINTNGAQAPAVLFAPTFTNTVYVIMPIALK